MSDFYKTVKGVSQGIYREKMSRFLAFAEPVSSAEEARAVIKRYANEYLSSDNGEPSGTAGKPILGQINSFELTNIVIVVIRYFGGIKLGTSGLINAYKTAARDALDNSTIVEKTINEFYSLEFEYPLMNEVMRIMKEENLEQQNPRFELDCYLEFSTRKNDASRVFDKFDNLFGVKITHIKTM